MTDTVSKATRSRMMAGIRGKDTKPEHAVRRYLHAVGLRFRLHDRRLPGTPDLVLPRYKTVVFINGCFWHQHTDCRYAATPATRPEFWSAKFSATAERDKRKTEALSALGWRALTIWECETTDDFNLDELFWLVVAGS